MARYLMAVAAVLTLSLLVSGCTSEGGRPTVTYSEGKQLPPLETVKKSGQLSLYAVDGHKPIWSERLGPGDEYGFVQRADGIVYGVAQGKDIPLPPSKGSGYIWKQQDITPPADADSPEGM